MKKLLLLACIYSNLLNGQQITFNVQSNFGNPYIFLRSIYCTDSSYYVTGIVQDSSNTVGTTFNKFDLYGNLILTKNLISPNKRYESWFGDIIPLQDGLIDIGQVTDSIEKGAIYKFDFTGDTIFTREYLSPFPNNEIFTPFEVVMMQNGKLAVLNVVEMSNLNNDILLTFHDNQYLVESEKLYGGPMDEVPGSMILDDDGGLIIGSNRANTNTNIKNYISKTYLFKVDTTGNVIWEYLSPNGLLQDKAYGMVKTSDGGLVVASGKGIEHVVNPEVSLLLWQGYIFKLNANHQLIWGRELRGTRHAGSPSFAKIVRATDGVGYVAYGRVGETVSTGSEVYGSWVVKVSNQGDSLWARYYSLFDDHLRQPTPIDFKVTSDGGYIVCGNTQEGQQTWGWLMKLDSFGCLIPGCNANDGPNAATEEKPTFTLAIYPNPTTDFLNFELRAPQLPKAASFRILDAGGRLVKEYHTDNPRDTFIVPVREWAMGVYYLQYLEKGEVRAVEKFMVSKR